MQPAPFLSEQREKYSEGPVACRPLETPVSTHKPFHDTPRSTQNSQTVISYKLCRRLRKKRGQHSRIVHFQRFLILRDVCCLLFAWYCTSFQRQRWRTSALLRAWAISVPDCQCLARVRIVRGRRSSTDGYSYSISQLKRWHFAASAHVRSWQQRPSKSGRNPDKDMVRSPPTIQGTQTNIVSSSLRR